MRLTGCVIDRMYGGQSLATVVVAVVVAAAHSEKAGKFLCMPSSQSFLTLTH